MATVKKFMLFLATLAICSSSLSAVPNRTKIKKVQAQATAQTFKKEDSSPILLTPSNTYVMSGGINNLSVDQTISGIIGKRVLLDAISGEEATLYLIISSTGGYYKSSLILKEFLATALTSANVKIICDYCGSAAGMLFITAEQERLVTYQSQVMMHEMYQPRFTANYAKDKELLQSLIQDSDIFNQMIYSELGITKEAYEAKIIDKEWNVYGKDLVKIKAADRYVIINCSPSLKAMVTLSICR
jgi:ATP-dependent protease ClpP protease subunit